MCSRSSMPCASNSTRSSGTPRTPCIVWLLPVSRLCMRVIVYGVALRPVRASLKSRPARVGAVHALAALLSHRADRFTNPALVAAVDAMAPLVNSEDIEICSATLDAFVDLVRGPDRTTAVALVLCPHTARVHRPVPWC